MSTLKSIIFETLPDPEEYYEIAEALRDLDRQYQHFNRTVWKASKQLMYSNNIPTICTTVNPDGTAVWKGLTFPLIER